MDLGATQENPSADGLQDVEVGALLRATREARGLDLARIAQHLRIKLEFLEAIEGLRSDGLPGQVYVLGFIRSYAEFLGLDGAELSRQYRRRSAAAPAAVLTFPSPAPTGRIPGPIPLAVGLAAFVALAGGWLFGRDQMSDFAALVAKAPGELMARLNASPPEPPPPPMTLPRPAPHAAPPPAPPPPTRQELTDHIMATAPAAPLAKLSTPTEPDPNEEAPTPPPMSLSSGQPLNPEVDEGLGAAGLSTAGIKTSEGKVYGQVTGPSRLSLKATAEVWVAIREPDGQALLTKVLRPGDVFRAPNRSGLTVSTGDAGALEVTVDNRPAPALGPKGQVLRLTRLDADKMKAQD